MQRHHLIALGLVVLAAGTFSEVPRMDFVDWDDSGNVFDNPHYRKVTCQSVAELWRRPMLGFYIPVVRTVWAGIAAVSLDPGANAAVDPQPFNPAPFHVANLLVHAANVLLVFGILRLLGLKDWPSAAGAAVFAVHPVQVEPVAWVTGLKDLLSALFALLALWNYLAFAKQAHEGGKPSRWRCAVSMLCFALAVSSKATVVVLPAIAFALDAGVLGRPWRRSALDLAGWVPISLAGAGLALWTDQGATATDLVAWWQRPFVAGDALAFYLGKLIAPVGIMAHYGRVPAHVMQHWWAWVTWLAPAAMIVALVWARKRAPELTVAGAIFITGLLPVLGLRPYFNQDVGMRFMYLGMLGAALAVAWAIRRWPTKPMSYLAGAAVVLLAGMSYMESLHWHGTLPLFERNLEANPGSWAAQNAIGRQRERAGDMAAAEEHYRAALALNRHYIIAQINLGTLLRTRGDFEGAIAVLRDAIETDPLHAEAQYHLGAAYYSAGRFEEAIAPLERAVGPSPGMWQARVMLSAVLANTGELEAALREVRIAIASNPNYALAYVNMGQTLLRMGREDEAREAFEQARRLGMPLQLPPQGAGAASTEGGRD
ncbi:MAG: tetratricopeptide repeat protein [candidate division WS1 bacterium]|jgi:Tfp pilus assembly protein PilF|nr:tetratricopeptide repeat protein [candidate division WS1 bacterium]